MTPWTEEAFRSFLDDELVARYKRMREAEEADEASGVADDPAYRQAAYSVPSTPAEEPDAPGLQWQWANELEAPAEPDWLWSGYLAPGAITLVAGKPKSGKSTLVCSLAEALAADADTFLGRPLRPGAVVYLSEEGAPARSDPS